MDHMIYALFITVFVPILLMSLLVEKKARFPVFFVLIGLYISLLASQINGYLNHTLDHSAYELTVVVAPIVEEFLKALPILFYALVFSDQRERLFTASMAIGVGFAILEDSYYLFSSGQFRIADAFFRAFGAGLMHGMCTLLVGFGISYVKKRKKTFLVGSLALLSAAIIYHSIYNMLILSAYQAMGILLPFVTYLPFFIWRLRTRLAGHRTRENPKF